MAKELPKRSEVEEKYTWNLMDLYPSIEAWEKDLNRYGEMGRMVMRYEGKVGDNVENLYFVLTTFTQMEEMMAKVFHYVQRLYDQDTADTKNQSYCGKAFNLYASVGSEIAFIDPEIIAIPDERLEQFYKEKEELEFFRRYVEEIRRRKEHCLSAELEKVMAMTAEMAQVPSDTYSVLGNADMHFPAILDEEGETLRITHGRFISLLESPNRELRKEVFEKYYGEYKQYLNTFASLYNGQVKKQIFYAKMRKYPSNLSAAVDENNVPVTVYRNLIDTVNANLDKMHAYVSLRKKLLQVDNLCMYDIYTPMIPGVAKKYSYSRAQDIILKALQPLGEEYVAKVKEGFENRWIDVYENQGKRSGAYSVAVYGVHPYVLMNYNESLDSVFTLIHEMGHSMHSYYSDAAQPYIYSQYKIFVAEVASTCNEVLLLEYLLKQSEDKKERAYLLNHYLDMFKGTLFRQTQFAEFELQSNEMAERGENLNADNLSSLYLELNQKYYGKDMVSNPEIAYEWARIPHFYYNFYVYQYATSFAAAVAIAHNILEQGAPMVEKYIGFLKSGCTAPPVDLLRAVGIDLEKPEPIRAALDVMEHVISELATLA
ncbi:MAG: oligoendopeptidase F [Lachnospiraceae bacterium]